jgi:hypothetical protein
MSTWERNEESATMNATRMKLRPDAPSMVWRPQDVRDCPRPVHLHHLHVPAKCVCTAWLPGPTSSVSSWMPLTIQSFSSDQAGKGSGFGQGFKTLVLTPRIPCVMPRFRLNGVQSAKIQSSPRPGYHSFRLQDSIKVYIPLIFSSIHSASLCTALRARRLRQMIERTKACIWRSFSYMYVVYVQVAAHRENLKPRSSDK